VAWVINLTVGQVRARERIIQGLIKMAIKLIPRISDGQFSLGAVPFHPTSKLHHNNTVVSEPLTTDPESKGSNPSAAQNQLAVLQKCYYHK
jgi:hypothetical protein